MRNWIKFKRRLTKVFCLVEVGKTRRLYGKMETISVPFVTVNGHVERFVLPTGISEIKQHVREVSCYDRGMYSKHPDEIEWEEKKASWLSVANMSFITEFLSMCFLGRLLWLKKRQWLSRVGQICWKTFKGQTRHKIKVETISDSNTVKSFN